MKKLINTRDKSVYPLKFSLKMKLAIYLFLITLFQVQASTYSQNTKISLNLKNVSLESVLNEIESRTEFKFLVATKEVDVNRIVSINKKNMRISKVLKMLFDDSNADIEVFNKQIIIKGGISVLVPTVKDAINEIQKRTITGIITSKSDKLPLPGTSVVIKGTSIGTQTDFDGNYSIKAKKGDVLKFSYQGMKTVSITIGDSDTINVSMEEEASELGEVVVTAFGVERKTRSLGYAISEVKGDKFTKARTTNIGNALSGKVAGVTVSTPSTGAGGTSRVQIRGGSSLTGNDQPLYVINGIPIDNTNLGSAGTWGGSDGGDGLSALNPDDIANISILKGNSAAALYGSRAANGVILVTTKSGKSQNGIGVSFNSNFQFDKIIDYTDFQKVYGYGTDGLKPVNVDGALENGNSSWGAKLDGTNVVQFDGVSRPYSDVGEGIKDFYNTGSTFTNTIGLSGGDEKHTYRFSASNLTNKGIVPNSGFDKNQFSANINGTYGKLSAKITAQYSKEERKNSPRVSDTPGNPNYTAFTKTSAISFNTLKGTTAKLGAKEDGTELRHQGNIYSQNPYWAAYQWSRFDEKDRILGNVSLKYDITEWLYIQGRLGLDFATNNLESVEAYGTAFKPLGSINSTTRNIKESNSDFFIGFDKEFGDFGVDILLGGNIQRFKNEQKRVGGNNLSIPFFHSVTNVVNQSYAYGFSERGVNSVFGQANFSYKDVLFLNLTGREDKFSTLAKGKNTLFYPSAGLSFVLSDAVTLPEVISFAKIRTSWAQVGGGAPNPYALNLAYKLEGTGHNGAVLGTINNGSIPNEELQPYTSTEIEFGVDLKFLNGRLGVDFTYYDRKTEDDILNTSISNTSGYGSTTINVGELTNKGVELMISGTPIRTDNFTWRTSFNMANNISKAVNLGSDSEGNPIQLINRDEARTRQERIRHVLGQPLGLIAGYKHKTINGSKVYDSNGFPVRSDNFEILAEGRHPFSAGLNNSFSYKNFNLNFLIDMRAGGSLMSGTNVLAYGTGLHKETLAGRENGLTVTGVDETGAALTKNIPLNQIDDYYGKYNDITEYFVYDASFGKLREFSIGYSFPNTMIKNTPFESLNFSLVGRNLFLLWSNVPNIDPESGYSSSGGSQGLEYFALPSTRTFGFNLSAQF